MDIYKKRNNPKGRTAVETIAEKAETKRSGYDRIGTHAL